MTTCNTTFQAARTAMLAALFLVPAFAIESGPLAVMLESKDKLNPGQPVTIVMTMKSAAAIQLATVAVQPSTDWQILDGVSHWTGSMKEGESMELSFRAVPLTAEPATLKVRYHAGTFAEESTSFDPARLGGRAPELVKAGGRIEEQQDFIEAHYEPGEQSATPDKGAIRQARVTASGRFRYRDDDDVLQPVRRAKVELWNVRSNSGDLTDPIDLHCGTGSTDIDGNFNIEVDCGDAFSGPDLAARIVLDNSKVTVRPAVGFAYTFQSAPIRNITANSVNFGNITITSNRGAFHAHSLVTRAERYMVSKGESMDKLTVLWPVDVVVANYNSFFKEIRLGADDAFRPLTVFHEYGHHILKTKSESPAPDYNNGICDDPQPGHCIQRPEKGVVSWTEGWPTFFGLALFDKHQAEDGYDGDAIGAFETRFTVRDEDEGKEDRIEGVVIALLWDLVDAANDDQFDTGAGRRDRVNLTFDDIWDVIQNFDPSSDIFHNHPTSIHELWAGLRSMRRDQINLISEAYREHNIAADQPDLRVTSTGALPASVRQGASFPLSNTVSNSGNDPAIAAFTVQIQLVHPTFGARNAGSRTVAADTAVGETSTASTTVSVAANLAPGSWTVRVCADSTGTVPESNESNNCRDAGSVNVLVNF